MAVADPLLSTELRTRKEHIFLALSTLNSLLLRQHASVLHVSEGSLSLFQLLKDSVMRFQTHKNQDKNGWLVVTLDEPGSSGYWISSMWPIQK